ncbi:MAG: ATP-binding cassette domain-containing protein [Bacilli bacterium]|nr:ATP-binding cassette domain-containing protein [Bacilli bacterium]
MLQVKNISKTYITGDLKQVALNDVTLSFRDNEFVSILGPSGSGKTTLLNIIGGLDQYDKGDLIINGISTKKYKSRDWDSYRNHTVGFVFQNYNLIPHQTILANVELALTISGVSKKERRKRALAALDEVGLKEQAHKKPNQMSGGQMQRVAVARSLVNDPDILLADEPTGALDSETSLQVMDLLKEIAKDRLVVMVTHNPDLAKEYSNRIIKIKDGEVIDDSNPVKDEKKVKVQSYKNLGKASMSILTAFSLSLNNLLTKKGRTILTAFAGSIGIIGIALILSLSNGFQEYINEVQEDMLTSYPLTIEEETANTTELLLSIVSKEKNENKEGVDVSETKNIEKLFSSVGKNDMKSFKKYIEERSSKVSEMVSYIGYQYSIEPNIYTRTVTNKIERVNPNDTILSMMGTSATSTAGVGMTMGVFVELTGSDDIINDSYTVIKGRMPKKYDEVIIVLPDENHISDLLLYALGLKDSQKLDNMMKKIMAGEKIEDDGVLLEYSYDDLLNLSLKLIDAADTYRYNESYNIYEDMTKDTGYMEDLYQKSIPLKIVGIVKPKDSDGMSSFMSGVCYRKELKEYVINQAQKKEIVKKQLNNKDVNVFSGKRFDDDSEDIGVDFNDLIKIDTDLLASAFNIQVNEAEIQDMTTGYMGEISDAITADTSSAKEKFTSSLSDIFKGLLNDYIDNHPIEGMEGFSNINKNDIEDIISNYFNTDSAKNILNQLESEYTIPATVYEEVYKTTINGSLNAYVMMAGGGEDTALIAREAVNDFVDATLNDDSMKEVADEFAKNMVEANMKATILTKVGELSGRLMQTMANAFQVDQEKIASAFQFSLTEEDIKRIFNANTNVKTAKTNLSSLGYQDKNAPSSISFYFKDFASKEKFIDFIEEYNKNQKKKDKEKAIEYTDITGIMISSVKVIVDSVSYVLIAFVSISLIVSSIMIGIITYISVLERTKEIGILRAIGASKKNISSIFNAETMIVGFLAGVLGVVVSIILLVPINAVIHALTNNPNITAIFPVPAMVALIILSTILTLIGGIIPSKKAAKQDPVLALRSE